MRQSTMESVKVIQPQTSTPQLHSPSSLPTPSASSQGPLSNHNLNNSQVIYTPRLKKVLKSYQAAATTSLNGPDWVPSRASSSSSSSSLPRVSSPSTPTQTPTGDLKSSHPPPPNMLVPPKQALPSAEAGSRGKTNKAAVDQKMLEDPAYDPFLAPPPFPIQQPPIFTPPDQSRCERTETILEGETISCFVVGGEKRLCLPQILTTVLREFTLQQINSVCDDMQIFCSRCTNEQLEVLKISGMIPASAPSCGLITKTDAERLCSALLHANPPKTTFHLNESANGKRLFSFRVYHHCFGKCTGLFVPSLYVQPFSPCVQCLECHGLFPPQKFVCHSHRSKENRTCHWGFDSSNWRAYLLLVKDDQQQQTEEQVKTLEGHLNEMKSRFDFKRKHTVPTSQESLAVDQKRLKVEESSCSTPNLFPYPSYLYSPFAWASDPSLLMYWYPGLAAGNNQALAARLSAFKPWTSALTSTGAGHEKLESAGTNTMPQGYGNLQLQKCAEPPLIIQKSDKNSSSRLDCLPDAAGVGPSLEARSKTALGPDRTKVNEKVNLKSSRDKISFPDDDSLSSTTTFSSENTNTSISDEECAAIKSEKLFGNLQTILEENNIELAIRHKIMNEVGNIVKHLTKALACAQPEKMLVPLAPNKLSNGLNQLGDDKKIAPITRRMSDEIVRRNHRLLPTSPLTLMPVNSCSPKMIKQESNPLLLTTQKINQVNCVH